MASDIVIQVDRLSKQYRLGEVSTGSLAHDVNRWWHRVRGRPDPYLKVTQANIREQKKELSFDYVWALRDVTFEVKRGDVLGIIGRNGAGKSTLLKILSRVTAPTEGEVRIDGRIASLLEVGTGFHQDLTGRENVFLNGAILGMTKAEIRGKLDEIVEFSGCARYLDTPVKRYSSGMMVRLGFAVAAHLEPDILVVDEVLAVGDAEFQKKCLGKIQDVASHGRTVLFVSHNMASIDNLCLTCLWLESGMLVRSGSPTDIITNYLRSASALHHEVDFDKRALMLAGNDLIMTNVTVRGGHSVADGSGIVRLGEDVVFEIMYRARCEVSDVTFYICLYDRRDDTLVFHANTRMAHGSIRAVMGDGVVRCRVPSLSLVPGEYRLDAGILSHSAFMDRESDVLTVRVSPSDYFGTGYSNFSGAGRVLFNHQWEIT